MELLIFAILLTVIVAQESQLNGPQNTLSAVGSNVTLKCSSPSRNCDGTEWLKYGGNPWTVFDDRGIMAFPYRDRYSVDNSSGCDLVIKNVELTDAGRFTCTVFISSNTFDGTAYLIIMSERPKCNMTTPVHGLMEGDEVQLTCEATYSGTSTASVLWKDVEDAPAAVVNNKTISRGYSVVAPAPEVPSFACIISFPPEGEYYFVRYNLASNIPITTCETPAVELLYSVRNVNLSPSLSVHSPGSVITCTAEGRPLPRFKWQELENNGTWMAIQNQSGSRFTVNVSSSRRYRCVAMNIVRGKIHKATSDQLQFHHTATEKLTSTSTNCPKEGLGVGIGVGAGIVFLVVILLASIAYVILVKLRHLKFNPRPPKKSPDGVEQHMDVEMSPASRQLSAIQPSIPRTEAPLVLEPESAYASLGEDRAASVYYECLEKRQKATQKKKPMN